MNRKSAYLAGAAAGALVFSGTASAQDVTAYAYDALGRLVASTTSGGPNSGLNVRTCYDSAGNRTTYAVATGGSSPPPCPPPPPPPPSASADAVARTHADV